MPADPATLLSSPASPTPAEVPSRPLLRNTRYAPLAKPLPRFDELAVDVTTPFILTRSVFERSVLPHRAWPEWERWVSDLTGLWDDSPVANFCPFGLLEPRSYVRDPSSGAYVSSTPAHFRGALRDLLAPSTPGRPADSRYLFQPLTPSRWNRLIARGDLPSTKQASLPAMLRASTALEEAQCFEATDLAVEWHYKTDWRSSSELACMQTRTTLACCARLVAGAPRTSRTSQRARRTARPCSKGGTSPRITRPRLRSLFSGANAGADTVDAAKAAHKSEGAACERS